MRFKKTRIVFSLVCGVLCLLLIGLWVRSYWVNDFVGLPTNGTTIISTWLGRICVERLWEQKIDEPGWWWRMSPTDEIPAEVKEAPVWYCFKNSANGWVGFPLWFPTVIFALLGTVHWLSTRFSLRTLLLVTTAVAVGLWLILWMAHR